MPMSLARWPRCPRCKRFFANPERDLCAHCPPPIPEVRAWLDGDFVTLTFAPEGGGRGVIVCRTFGDVVDALRACARLAGPALPPIQES